MYYIYKYNMIYYLIYILNFIILSVITMMFKYYYPDFKTNAHQTNNKKK